MVTFESIFDKNDPINTGDYTKNDPVNDKKNDTKKLSAGDRRAQIISLMQNNPKITIDKLSDLLNVSEITIKRDINRLKKASIIYREGSLTDGKWLVNKDKFEQRSE